jgi:peptidoglycan lytic transglycosylase
MLMRRNASNVNGKEPLQFWLTVGFSCLALVVAVMTLSTGTVQANAVLSRPAPVALPPALKATPVFIDPAGKKPGSILHGVASWYGTVFNGRKTASGEVYDMNALTACHPTLPFGSKVRVVDTRNHRSVVVRINDRGYLPGKRIIDLSYAAAKKLHMEKSGLAEVRIEVLSRGHEQTTN